MNLGVKRHIVLYLTALPWNLLIAWPVVLLIRAFWGENLRWENRRNHIPFDKKRDHKPAPGGPFLCASIKEGSWPVNPKAKWPGGWYLKKIKNQRPSHVRTWGGTTLGHGVFFGPGRSSPGVWTPLEEHEIGAHGEQFEAAMFRGFLIGLTVVLVMQSTASLWLGAALWFTGYLQMGIANWTTAWLRGEDPYRGSAHEEAAYAIDELYEQQQQVKEQN